MSFIFGKIGFVYSVFDSEDEDEDEQENFFIEEIRYCNCFFDEFQYLIRRNNFRISLNEIYDEFTHLPRKFRAEDFFLYYSKISIFCCEECVNLFCRLDLIDPNEMDKNCDAEKVDYCCLYYLSREFIFNCICHNCQKTLLKLASKKLNITKLK